MVSFNARTAVRKDQDGPSGSSIEVEVVPQGMYLAEVIRADSWEKAPENPGNKTTVVVSFYYKILEGECTDKVIKQLATIAHQNPVVEEISGSKMGHMCDAVGLPGFKDEKQMVGKRLRLRVGIKGERNEFYGFYPAKAPQQQQQAEVAFIGNQQDQDQRAPSGTDIEW